MPARIYLYVLEKDKKDIVYALTFSHTNPNKMTWKSSFISKKSKWTCIESVINSNVKQLYERNYINFCLFVMKFQVFLLLWFRFKENNVEFKLVCKNTYKCAYWWLRGNKHGQIFSLM